MPPKYNALTPVIFRMMNGECVAIMPTLKAHYGENPLTSCRIVYSNLETGAASLLIGQRARLATRAEYMPMKKRLQDQGYRLHVIKRISSHHNNIRKDTTI